MKKRVMRFIIVCVVTVALEFLFFNFSYIRTYFAGEAEHNIVFVRDELIFIHWERYGDSYISLPDPQIILKNINAHVRDFIVEFDSVPVAGVTVFYTDGDNPYFSDETIIFIPGTFEGSLTVPLYRHINDLRVDLGEEAGIALSDVQITLNPRVFDFSFSRIAAVVIVYLVVMFLFSLQKIPSYHNEVKSDAN